MRLRAVLLAAGIATLAAAAPAHAANFKVTGTGDGTGSCDFSGDPVLCPTLRGALTEAARMTGADTILLPGLGAGKPYVVSAGQLTVSSQVTITGDNAATTTIQSNGESRIFNITAASLPVTINHVTLTGGKTPSTDGLGGNIKVGTNAILTLDHVRVTGGSALRGGGLAIGPATNVTITQSLIDGNDTQSVAGVPSDDGGAIYSQGDAKVAGNVLAISDSTIYNNTAGSASGLELTANPANTTTLNRVTIAGNAAATGTGAGVFTSDAESVTFDGSIVAGNTVKLNPGNCSAKFTTTGGNIDTGTTCGFGSGDKVGTDPQLKALDATLGETPVLPILATSPATDFAGACGGNDQRDLDRPQGTSCDSGAFEVDQPPNTTIRTGPSGTVTTSTATFTFISTDTGSTFQCSIDSAAYKSCASGQSYPSLADGGHTFSVRAIDPALNVDPTPATRAWTIDTTPPDTSIASDPPLATNSTAASFTYTSTESSSTFECSLDGAAFTSCPVAGQSYSSLTQAGHTFSVRATDATGHTDPTPATYMWTVDTTPPDTTIIGGPTGPTKVASPTFGLSSPDGTATFQCKLDGPGTTTGSFAACTTPASYTLADGVYTLSVRAVDPAGNFDPTPATRGFTVDTIAPDTIITSGPNGLTNSANASFAFNSTESGGSLQCSLDGAAFTTCTSPQAYPGLAQGAHTFAVKATDAAGNTDATPATRGWTVDTIAPNTTIDNTPPARVAGAISFTFSATETNSTFQCRLDTPAGAGGYGNCTSPKAYSGLTEGNYRFHVVATDPAGNPDPSDATFDFTVDTTAPDTTITGGPTGLTNAPSFSFNSPDATATFQCQIDSGGYSACTSPKAYGGLAEGAHTFFVRAVDAAGNIDGTPASRGFTLDTIPPDTTITGGPTGTVNVNSQRSPSPPRRRTRRSSASSTAPRTRAAARRSRSAGSPTARTRSPCAPPTWPATSTRRPPPAASRSTPRRPTPRSPPGPPARSPARRRRSRSPPTSPARPSSASSTPPPTRSAPRRRPTRALRTARTRSRCARRTRSGTSTRRPPPVRSWSTRPPRRRPSTAVRAR